MKTESPWLHRYAIFVAFCALIAIILGAIETSLERPIAPNCGNLHQPCLRISHHMIAGVAVIVVFGPGAWIPGLTRLDRAGGRDARRLLGR